MKDISPKISVIVPVYNVEDYLDRCVQSIINQTYKNLEIILVDDGSPDNCGRICDEYAIKDNRIKVIHKENGGLSDARNTGINVATGDFFGFVDSDDFIHPEMYETLLLNILKDDVDISVCYFEKVTDDIVVFDKSDYKVLTINNLAALDQLFTFGSINIVIAWNKLYKRDLFYGIQYPQGRIREDEFTTYKLLYRAKRIGIVERAMYYYFQREGSIMNDRTLSSECHFAEAQEERLEFFVEKKLEDLYLLALKRYCMWLMSMIFIYYTKRKDYPQMYQLFKQKRKKYINRLIAENDMPKLNKFIYILAKTNPYFPGFFAYQKLYRFNVLSKVAGFLFFEPKSLIS